MSLETIKVSVIVIAAPFLALIGSTYADSNRYLWSCEARFNQTQFIRGDDGSLKVEISEFRSETFPIRDDVKLENQETERSLFPFIDGKIETCGKAAFSIKIRTGTNLGSPQGDIVQGIVSIFSTVPATQLAFVAPVESPWIDVRQSVLALPEQGGGTLSLYCVKHTY